MSKKEQYTRFFLLDNREQLERISKNLSILHNHIDVYNRCLSLLEQGEATIFEAINSPDSNEKKTGIYLIVCLVELNSAEENIQVTRFARNLLKILICSDENVIRLASRAITYLIQTSKTYAVELMEISLNQCCEWLEETQRNEERLLAAVILARDLALFTSSHFFQRASHFFTNIFKVIRDTKITLRIYATQALHVALSITSQRETKLKNEWYKHCFDEACVKTGREESNHASLLIFNELLRIANSNAENMRLKVLDISASFHARTVIGLNSVEWLTAAVHPPAVESQTARTLVTDLYFNEIINRCIELTSLKSKQCQLMLLEIFPRLCDFDNLFDKIPFQNMLNYAMNLTNRHPQALITVGLLAVTRPEDIRPKVFNIFKAVVQIIQQSVSKKKKIEISVFKCLSLLIKSQKELLRDKIFEIFPLLFSTGLSKGLTEVFKEVVESVPELKTDVLDGLMEQLYFLLMNRQRPSKLAPPTQPPIPTEQIQPTDIELTKLALKTLGEFDFQRHILQMFMRYIAQGYLICDSLEIRLTSVYCCAEILKPFVKIHDLAENEQKMEAHSLIKNVLECLVRTAVVDPEVEVRLSVLKCFCTMEHDFLYHLGQREMLENLFKTLHDENYQMQEQSVILLGQLSNLNPALVMPKLRRIVLEAISQLVNSHVPKIEEQSVKIIAKLAIQSPKFMSSYLHSLLLALIPHLQLERRGNVEVTIQVMNALSELSVIGGLDLVRCVDKLFPPLIVFLRDSTSLNRREAALRAMGAICQSTGYIVDPYKDYPELLDILLKLLKTELSVSMRRLTMKILGIIGALDPYTHKVYLGTVYSHKSKSIALTLPNVKDVDDPKSDVSDIIQWINYERYTLLEYYPALVVANLVEILQDEALTTFHKEIVCALFQIFYSLGSKSSQYVNQVVPRLIKITEDCKPDLREFFLGQFSKFAAILGIQLKGQMKQIFSLIAKAWNWNESSSFRCVVIGVLEEVGKTFGQEFTPYVTDLCPYLSDIVQNDRSKDRKLTLQAFSCVRSIVVCVGAHIHLILSSILYVLDDKQAQERVRLLAIDTLIELALNQQIAERTPTIMQSWLRCMSVKALQEKLMQLLSIIVNQMWDQFLVYKDSVSTILNRYKVEPSLRQEFNELITQIISSVSTSTGGSILPRLCKSDYFSSQQSRRDNSTKNSQKQFGGSNRENRHLINIDQLRKFWSVQSITSRDDWLQWLSTLRTQFIRQSPSTFIRACASLAELHEPLAKELFNAAFMSVWTEINEIEQDELSNHLVDVLTLCPHAESVQTILNLAEFMDHSEKGPLPVTYRMLSKSAEQTRAYAKALRYKELEILNVRNGEPNSEDCQALIIYANKLNLEEYSAGVVQYAEKMNMNISGRWYEKLGEWEKALEMYRTELADNSKNSPNSESSNSTVNSGAQHQACQNDYLKATNNEILIHQMRCLEALGRWSELEEAGSNVFAITDELGSPIGSGTQHPSSNNSTTNLRNEMDLALNETEKQQKIAQMAARASCALGNFNKMKKFVQLVNQNTQEGAFLRAVIAIKNNHFKDAFGYIHKVRDMFDADLTAMAAESYERAYGATILLQQLTELEEAIEYKMIPERSSRISMLWSRRLQGCRRNISQWQKILLVRSIVMSESELRPMWLKYSALCRRQGKLSMSRHVLQSLLGLTSDTPLSKISISTIALDSRSPQLALAVCKQLWIEGQRRSALSNLENLASTLHRLINRKRSEQIWTREKLELNARITAKCYLKLGEWHSQMLLNTVGTTSNTSGLTRRGSVAIPIGVNYLNVPGYQMGAPVNVPNYSTFHQQYFRQLNYQRFNNNTQIQAISNNSNFEQLTKVVLQYYINATNFNPSWYKAWHRLATTYYNLVMSDRQNKFNGIEQQQNFSPNDLSNSGIGYSNVPQNYASMAFNNINVNTTTNDALLAKYHQQHQAALLQGQVPINAAQGIIPQAPFFYTNRTNLIGIQHPIGYAPQQFIGVTQMPAEINNEGYHLTQFPPLVQVPTNIGINYGPPFGNAPATNIPYNNMCPIGIVTQESTVVNEHKMRQHSSRLDEITNQATNHIAVDISPSASNIQASILLKIQQQQQILGMYASHAVRCFFKAIQLAEGSRLDDTLRLLMLWFDYGERPEVFEVLRDSLKLVSLESWLEVMPQLISRLDSQQNTGLLVKQLIIDISKVHPQALIYALTAAAKSRNTQRSKVAKEILEIMSNLRPVLVEQAQLLNDELIRCAILWHELWHEALEDASRFYFQEKNTEEMMNILRPLHAKIEKGHATLKEQSFIQTYYKELKDAYEHCEAFHITNNQKELQAAWDLYFIVFKRMTSQLRQMTTLDLNYISPRLVQAQNLEISIPGTYDPQSPLITISSIHNYLQVIMSKQRPRKIYMKGSDGKEYAFLLKGHEDPRQDERVMQLFGLINSLILRDSDTCRRNISIQRYSIITLSQSSGLIGWLPNCDILHALVKDYREKKKIVLSEEHTKMQKMVIDIDKVTLMQKVEAFEETLRLTSGDDLRQALWMKSPNSEVWFDRRTNYTRSMACMSMVGYILGLGDRYLYFFNTKKNFRHPSNLMLDRINGKIVHIDFGDCFEVAMKRDKYPEKIPFRLTRMLIKAMEVTGIEGNYRLTCERVLRLLRNSNNSILAVLEAFVYDPVLNWRLVENGAKKNVNEVGETNTTNRFDGNIRGDCEAINRVKAKLCGRDFNLYQEISVSEQVNRLIEQATLNDNLCQCYIGWCPFW